MRGQPENRPRSAPHEPRAASRRGRRVLVIGAGPAGAAAALEAAAAGDAVTLVEREHAIGGQLRLAGLAPAHIELWERYRGSTLGRLHAAGVAVEHGVEADAELAAGFDLVVLATGARPLHAELARRTGIRRLPGVGRDRRARPSFKVPRSSRTGAAAGTGSTPPNASRSRESR